MYNKLTHTVSETKAGYGVEKKGKLVNHTYKEREEDPSNNKI